jgi:dTMP kinase
MTSGCFISFEGPECAGKSTQVTLSARALRGRGREVLETREPGGTRVGEELRQIVKHLCGEDAVCDEAELMIFAASRAQLVRKIILPFLAQGGVVLCDRFGDSTSAYQGFGRGFDLSVIDTINSVATCGRWPDLTILMDLPVDVAFDRARLRTSTLGVEDRIEDESRDFHERVRNGYLELAKRYPERIKVVDATQSVESIHIAIMEQVDHVISPVR